MPRRVAPNARSDTAPLVSLLPKRGQRATNPSAQTHIARGAIDHPRQWQARPSGPVCTHPNLCYSPLPFSGRARGAPSSAPAAPIDLGALVAPRTKHEVFVDWQERYFKGKKVWIKVDHLGDPVIESGRVEMRYQNAEDAKVYRAAANNISDQPADLIDATREFEKKLAGKAPASKSKSSKSGTKPAPGSITSLESPERWGPRHESTRAPSNIAALEWPDEGVVEIYTDGACSGNPGPCGYGVVIRDGEDYREIGQYLGQGTNNIGELMGIKTALEAVEDRSRPVHIYTDSTYCIGVLTKGWKAKANRELILEIRELVAKFSNLTFHKVKGHSDHPLNDRADFMATSSLDDAR